MDWLGPSVTDPGVTAIPTLDASVMLELADFVGSALLVAVTVTVCVPLMVAGAVYSPFDRVPTAGLIDQVTAVFVLPATVAVSCCDWPANKVTTAGDKLTETPWLVATVGVITTVADADIVGSA